MSNEISIVIPVYNEEENIKELYSEIKKTISDIDYEIIFVDDGSTDRTWQEIKNLSSLDSRIKALRFAKNFGQTQALKAGIDFASKKLILTMDGDLQNDPKDIKKLLSAMDENCDVVAGWRKDRKDKFLTRVLPSKIANLFISLVTGIKLHDYGCTLKLYRSEFIREIDLFGEMHRFIPALIGYKGGRIKEIIVNHRPRHKGKSKYGLERSFKVFLDLITIKFMGEFISKPLYLFGGVSIVLGFISVILALITLYNKLYNHIFVKDQPLFLVAIFIATTAIQIALIGILAEVMVRIYQKLAGKAYFVIKEKINLE